MSRWLAATNLTKQCGISIFFVQFLFFFYSLFWTVVVGCHAQSNCTTLTLLKVNTIYEYKPCTLRLARFYQLNQLNIQHTNFPFQFDSTGLLTLLIVSKTIWGLTTSLREEYLCEHCKQHHWSSDNALSRPQRNNLNEDEFRKVAVDLVFEEC